MEQLLVGEPVDWWEYFEYANAIDDATSILIHQLTVSSISHSCKFNCDDESKNSFSEILDCLFREIGGWITNPHNSPEAINDGNCAERGVFNIPISERHIIQCQTPDYCIFSFIFIVCRRRRGARRSRHRLLQSPPSPNEPKDDGHDGYIS